MKSMLLQVNEHNAKASAETDEIRCFLEKIKYNVGERILLVGRIGSLGKRLRMYGTSVTILEDGNYEDVCYSLVHNENCNVVKGTLEYLPFEDNYFDKLIVVDQLDEIQNFKKASFEIRRVLKNEGDLIIEDLNFKNFKVKLEYLKDRFCGFHSKFYYPHEVFNAFLNLNFEGKLEEFRTNKYIYIGKRR